VDDVQAGWFRGGHRRTARTRDAAIVGRATADWRPRAAGGTAADSAGGEPRGRLGEVVRGLV